MKKKLLLSVTALTLACSSTQASCFKIEDEEKDYNRIACQVHSFLKSHEILIEKLTDEDLQSKDNQLILKEIVKQNHSTIIKNMQENENFWSELTTAYKNIKSQETLLQEKLGDTLYKRTLKGLLLIANIFKASYS